MKDYLVDYETKEGTFSFIIPAQNTEDAKEQLTCIKNSAKIVGEITEIINKSMFGVPDWRYAVMFGFGLFFGYII